MLKITEVAGIRVNLIYPKCRQNGDFKPPQVQEYLMDGAEIWCGYNTLISTLTSPNLTKIWRDHVLSFVDLKWNDPYTVWLEMLVENLIWQFGLNRQN